MPLFKFVPLPCPPLYIHIEVIRNREKFTPHTSTEYNVCLLDLFHCKDKNVIILELMNAHYLNNCSLCLVNWSTFLHAVAVVCRRLVHYPHTFMIH
jgi:hypothetical protein